jgi:hypothetical protein
MSFFNTTESNKHTKVDLMGKAVFCGDMMARVSVLLDARTCMTWKEGMVSFGPHSLQPKTHKNEAPKMMLGAGSLVAIRRHYRNESTRTLIL